MTSQASKHGRTNDLIVGQVLAERGRRRWTMQQLADESGIPKRTLDRYLSQERTLTLAAVDQLAEAFGMTYIEFVNLAWSEAGEQ